MPSLRASLALMAAAAVLGVNSQVTYEINPDNVPLATRSQWCTTQQASCPLLCLQTANATDETTESNTCDPTTLVFSCVCDNGLEPNYNNFSQTIPFFECQEYVIECRDSCNGDTACQSACTDDHPCGAQNPTRVNITSTTTTAGPTGTGSTSPAVFTGLGDGSSTSTTTKKNGSKAAIEVGRSYGLAIIFTGLFAGFAFIM